MAQAAGDRRGLVFAALVAVLAAVGIYVTIVSEPGDAPGDTREATVGAPRTAPAAASPTPVATASDAPFDIYSFLPMSKQELAAAADVARRFTAAYGTYRYDEDPAAYAARITGFTTGELGDMLSRTVAAPGAIEQNQADQLVAEGTARVKEIRQVDQTSVVFVVAATQKVTTLAGPAEKTEDYAVTLVQVGADWRVYDLQPAEVGQEGDPSPEPEGGR